MNAFIAVFDLARSGRASLISCWPYGGSEAEFGFGVSMTDAHEVIVGSTTSRDLFDAVNGYGGGFSDGYIFWLRS
jgi:hypothetical protein